MEETPDIHAKASFLEAAALPPDVVDRISLSCLSSKILTVELDANLALDDVLDFFHIGSLKDAYSLI